MNRKFSKKDIIGVSVFAILILIAVFFAVDEKLVEQQIKMNYSVTKGSFVSYNESGGDRNAYVRYSITINDSVYFRKVMPKKYFGKCQEKDCTGKRFWVIFLPSAPEKSLIDLTTEIQGEENPPFPSSLDNFQ
ncbi:MAG: hypothetical protein MI866_16705 [Bacteroidales bacterium]|nr:hypothetical protein [Bacteroidales bacterium]